MPTWLAIAVAVAWLSPVSMIAVTRAGVYIAASWSTNRCAGGSSGRCGDALTDRTEFVHLANVLLGAALPTGAISVVAGVAFLGFAAWSLRGDSLDDDDTAKTEQSTRSAIVTVGVAFVVAELGDKDDVGDGQLATNNGLVGTWLGDVGMVAANALAIVVGQQLGARLPARAIKIGAAATFVVFGLILIAEGLR